MIVVLMGVSGSGKSTIGRLLAGRCSVVFADADDFHPEANRHKLAAGIPLTDEDRQPWLEALNHLMAGWFQANVGGVLACSALKDRYRATLSQGLPPTAVSFVWLDGSRELIANRLAHRAHEFMNPGLLDSQLATLEPPQGAVRVMNDRPPDGVVDEILQQVTPAA